MSFIDRLKPDVSHPFVQLVQQYRDEGKLEAEFARRQEVYADRLKGRKTADAVGSGTRGKGRPAMTPDETRELLQKITAGKIVPSPLQNYSLALQFGLVGGQVYDFIDSGGQYIMDMARRGKTAPAAASKEKPVIFKPGEMFGAAIVDLMKQRRYTNRQDAIVTPDDERFSTLNAPRTNMITYSTRIERGHRLPSFTEVICGGNVDLSRKVGFFIKRVFDRARNAQEKLLTAEEIDTIADNMKLNDMQRLRLHMAHENTRARIAFMNDPEIQDALIMKVFKALDGKEFDGENLLGKDEGGAFAALQRILLIRNMGVSDAAVTGDWRMFSNPQAATEDREAAYDRIASTAGLTHIEGADVFRQKLLSEDITQAEGFRRGRSVKGIIGDSEVDDGGVGRH